LTNPTITNNQGLLEDCYDTSTYGAIVNPGAQITGPTFTVEDDDFFALQGTYDGAGSDYIYVERDLAPNVLGYPSNTHYVCH